MPATTPIAAERSEISSMRNGAGGGASAIVQFGVGAGTEPAGTDVFLAVRLPVVLMDAWLSFLFHEGRQNAGEAHRCPPA